MCRRISLDLPIDLVSGGPETFQGSRLPHHDHQREWEVSHAHAHARPARLVLPALDASTPHTDHRLCHAYKSMILVTGGIL